jgi:hypothetical protein
MDYLRSLFATLVDEADEVEACSLTAFALLIGSHLITADHPGFTREQVLERAARRLGL